MSPLSPRMIRSAIIDRYGKKFNTSIERQFQDFAEANSLPYKMNESRDFLAENRRGELQVFSFQLDFVEFAEPGVFATWKVTGYLPTNVAVKTDIEVDGEGHKDQNDPWKDRIKNRYGIRVIHVPGYLCRPKQWPVLLECLRNADELPPRMPERTVYLDEYSR